MSDTSKLILDDQTVELPNIIGTENERAVDIRKLRGQTGVIAYDEGFRSTGSCQSEITFINGEEGILRYRGIPIEQLAENSNFIETAWLVIFGQIPTTDELTKFKRLIASHADIDPRMDQAIASMSGGHPMAIFSAMLNGISCYHPDMNTRENDQAFLNAAAMLIAKGPSIAASIHKHAQGPNDTVTPNPKAGYCENFLHMMFSGSKQDYKPHTDEIHALSMLLLLHADHEQNCSTSTVRMVGSSEANLFASCAAGVGALWGPLHGGANLAVLEQLNEIHQSKKSVADYLEELKQNKGKLFGFGHAVYKNFDPRARILKRAADKVLSIHQQDDALLDIARQLEEAALKDDYFVQRKLYPNVDFYSGIIMRAMGIPQDMFTVIFAIGRMAGWIAHYREVWQGAGRIYRPRQVYVGPTARDYQKNG